ncbi:MAG: DUF896 domain-containing protein [Eubacteriales bacterium]
MTEERIERMNELWHKSKGEGLTAEELEEQKVIRSEYMAAIRGSLRGQLEHISIQEQDGTIRKLKKKNNE